MQSWWGWEELPIPGFSELRPCSIARRLETPICSTTTPSWTVVDELVQCRHITDFFYKNIFFISWVTSFFSITFRLTFMKYETVWSHQALAQFEWVLWWRDEVETCRSLVQQDEAGAKVEVSNFLSGQESDRLLIAHSSSLWSWLSFISPPNSLLHLVLSEIHHCQTAEALETRTRHWLPPRRPLQSIQISRSLQGPAAHSAQTNPEEETWWKYYNEVSC